MLCRVASCYITPGVSTKIVFVHEDVFMIVFAVLEESFIKMEYLTRQICMKRLTERLRHPCSAARQHKYLTV